jgi:hypothetical protein
VDGRQSKKKFIQAQESQEDERYTTNNLKAKLEV